MAQAVGPAPCSKHVSISLFNTQACGYMAIKFCGYLQFNPSELLDDYCYDVRFQACISRRTHLYFNAPVLSDDDDGESAAAQEADVQHQSDVTMVTQLQYNRLAGLLALLDSWSGPLQVLQTLPCFVTTCINRCLRIHVAGSFFVN